MDKITSFKKQVEILENLPQVLKEIDEIKAIANVEDPILSAEWGLIDEYVDNQFIISANDYGLSRYEKMLKLKVLETDTIETRIFRLMALYQSKAPYTWKVLNSMLDDLLGKGKYVAERDVAGKVLTIKLELVVSQQINILSEMLERIIPANMIIDVILRYNTWRYISQFQWGQLLNYTWKQVKEDELNPPPYIPEAAMSTFTHDGLSIYTHDQLRLRKQG